ncbi:hypothetical protein B0H13DRAFT_2099971 [Mycena leptocephala]|nr:hypothetical protein B0H13DRAFT_2099971 [Mycena leptocephala]
MVRIMTLLITTSFLVLPVLSALIRDAYRRSFLPQKPISVRRCLKNSSFSPTLSCLTPTSARPTQSCLSSLTTQLFLLLLIMPPRKLYCSLPSMGSWLARMRVVCSSQLLSLATHLARASSYA